MRVVLDTNVVMDWLHFRDAAARPLAAAIAAGTVTCLADAATLEELARVVAYPEFGLDMEARARLLRHYRKQVALVADGEAPRLPRCKDADDQKFLELAARGGADLLVSKDMALLGLKGRQGLSFRIVSPAGAGALLAQ